MRHLGETVTEEYISGKAERCEDGRLLRIRLEHGNVTRSTSNVYARHGGCRTTELTRSAIEIIGRHGLWHVDKVMLRWFDTKDIGKRFRPHLTELAHVAHLHGQGIEPYQACLVQVTILQQHLGTHHQGQFCEISAHTLRVGNRRGPLKIWNDPVAITH